MGECILTIVPSISHLTRVQEIIAVTNYICKLADSHIFIGDRSTQKKDYLEL